MGVLLTGGVVEILLMGWTRGPLERFLPAP